MREEGVEGRKMERVWEKKSVEMEVCKGEGAWILVKMKGKDGKELKMIMKQVDYFVGERKELGF